MPASVLEAVAGAFGEAGIDLGALGHAWARAAPIVVLVPAFGLRALPVAARAVIALALSAVIVPGVAVGSSGALGGETVTLLADVTRGLSIALAAAIPLWAATMAGGVIDALRGTPGAEGQSAVPTVEGRATHLGAPLAILASAIFLAGGGAARVVAAVARPESDPSASPVLHAARDLSAGITLAVALAAPLLLATIVIDVGTALVARAASPAQVHTLIAPVRSLVVLVVLAIGIDRIAAALALAMR